MFAFISRMSWALKFDTTVQSTYWTHWTRYWIRRTVERTDACSSCTLHQLLPMHTWTCRKRILNVKVKGVTGVIWLCCNFMTYTGTLTWLFCAAMRFDMLRPNIRTLKKQVNKSLKWPKWLPDPCGAIPSVGHTCCPPVPPKVAKSKAKTRDSACQIASFGKNAK